MAVQKSNSRTFIGFKPFSYQKAVIYEVVKFKGTGKICVCKSQRQRGKSYMISNILLYFGINYANTTNFYLSPTLKQAKQVYKIIVDAIAGSGVMSNCNATDLTIAFINGSTINFKSAEMRNALRGYTCTGILCIDEAAFISDEVYDIVKPWCDFHNAVTLMCSSPFVKDGFFYQYWSYGLEGTHNVVSVDWTDERFKEDMDKVMPPERLEEYRHTLPANVFKSEYMGQFLDSDGLLFNYIRDNATSTATTGTEYYIGIDFGSGGGNDFTSLSVFNEKGEMCGLDYFNDLSTFQQVDRLVMDIERYGKQIKYINAENNSIGNAFIDLIIKKLNEDNQQYIVSKINRFVTSNESKSKIVTQVQVGLEQFECKLLNDKVLIHQMESYEATYNPTTQKVTYNGAVGINDDCVMSTMLAWDAYKNNKRGQYIIR